MFISMLVVIKKDLTTIVRDPKEKRVGHHWIVIPDLRDMLDRKRKVRGKKRKKNDVLDGRSP